MCIDYRDPNRELTIPHQEIVDGFTDLRDYEIETTGRDVRSKALFVVFDNLVEKGGRFEPLVYSLINNIRDKNPTYGAFAGKLALALRGLIPDEQMNEIVVELFELVKRIHLARVNSVNLNIRDAVKGCMAEDFFLAGLDTALSDGPGNAEQLVYLIWKFAHGAGEGLEELEVLDEDVRQKYEEVFERYMVDFMATTYANSREAELVDGVTAAEMSKIFSESSFAVVKATIQCHPELAKLRHAYGKILAFSILLAGAGFAVGSLALDATGLASYLVARIARASHLKIKERPLVAKLSQELEFDLLKAARLDQINALQGSLKRLFQPH